MNFESQVLTSHAVPPRHRRLLRQQDPVYPEAGRSGPPYVPPHRHHRRAAAAGRIPRQCCAIGLSPVRSACFGTPQRSGRVGEFERPDPRRRLRPRRRGDLLGAGIRRAGAPPTCVPSHAEWVVRFAAEAGVGPQVVPLVCDAVEVPGENRFDAAVAVDSSGYLPRKDWFRRLALLLRPRGSIYIIDCFLCQTRYAELFNRHWHTRIGTIEEYLDAAREAGLSAGPIIDVTDRTTHFWTTTLALIEAEFERRPFKRSYGVPAHAVIQSPFHGARRFGRWRTSLCLVEFLQKPLNPSPPRFSPSRRVTPPRRRLRVRLLRDNNVHRRSDSGRSSEAPPPRTTSEAARTRGKVVVVEVADSAQIARHGRVRPALF